MSLVHDDSFENSHPMHDLKMIEKRRLDRMLHCYEKQIALFTISTVRIPVRTANIRLDTSIPEIICDRNQRDDHHRRHSALHQSREKEQKTLASASRENRENVLLSIDNQLQRFSLLRRLESCLFITIKLAQ